ncbi:hypothetical protein BOO69_01445 [Sulfitobacter alexandrii]|uniref:Sulfotransferase family protein n=1 Tax=Sulfitobacter alexandrii TaxID=1917485 RepID=A0A1J0WDI0_9RHOB|nr:hypothetical protein [Sulfitobacter alexandrii]APE42222.1 hypothetical protein BOO69_01445 [Sulfitobacter alexandrii]
MPRRIILHAGFHKTGTSTIQSVLRENRVALKKHVALRLRWHMKDLVAATRGYSTWRDPLTLIKVQDRFTRLMDDLPGMPRRTLVISAEELSGHLPGRGELADYSAAPILLYAFWEIARARYPEAEILIYLSTRAPGPWLESAWAEHVKASNMTLPFEDFAARYHGAANLDAMVAEIASRVPVPVHHRALESCLDLPLGPADPLLDLCDLPAALRAGLVPVAPANTRLKPEILQAMLEANRTQDTAEARNAAKAQLLKDAR